ncbi:helix-turn-helix transcriptional regulator [Sutterella sp.]|uniref:helix-turn-helix transcriptional regulator n=1 Tax=Sutterella sp. TaxID=1981025 RepID=UPI003FD8DF37
MTRNSKIPASEVTPGAVAEKQIEAIVQTFSGRLAVDARDGCRALGIGKSTWFELRKTDPTFPKPFRIGASVRYPVADLIAWMQARMAETNDAEEVA